jgi:hypothetical protein
MQEPIKETTFNISNRVLLIFGEPTVYLTTNRNRVLCCGSAMFIPDHGSNNSNKREGEIICCPTIL